jgi:aspartate kinase
MKIIQFGGPEIHDVASIQSLATSLKALITDKVVVVTTAFGITAAHLERVVKAAFYQEEDPALYLDQVVNFHFNLVHEIIKDPAHSIFSEINNCFVELEWSLDEDAGKGYDFLHDQVVAMGEVLASKILSAALNEAGIANNWFDIRDCIQTDNTYGNAKVDVALTTQYIQEVIPNLFSKGPTVLITQGGIGTTSENFTTFLGPEAKETTCKLLSDGLGLVNAQN